MTILHYLGRLYSLDTLDTRFTSHSKTLVPHATKTAGRAGTDAPRESTYRIEEETSKPLWATLEYYVYYLVILLAVPSMFKVAYDVSNCEPT